MLNLGIGFDNGLGGRSMKIHWILALSFGLLWLHAIQATELPDAKPPQAIPTFHCLGIYWSPVGGSVERAVDVQYRQQGQSGWREALPMCYNPIPETDEDLADYRGSIVNLMPATTYEIQLTLA